MDSSPSIIILGIIGIIYSFVMIMTAFRTFTIKKTKVPIFLFTLGYVLNIMGIILEAAAYYCPNILYRQILMSVGSVIWLTEIAILTEFILSRLLPVFRILPKLEPIVFVLRILMPMIYFATLVFRIVAIMLPASNGSRQYYGTSADPSQLIPTVAFWISISMCGLYASISVTSNMTLLILLQSHFKQFGHSKTSRNQFLYFACIFTSIFLYSITCVTLWMVIDSDEMKTIVYIAGLTVEPTHGIITQLMVRLLIQQKSNQKSIGKNKRLPVARKALETIDIKQEDVQKEKNQIKSLEENVSRSDSTCFESKSDLGTLGGKHLDLDIVSSVQMYSFYDGAQGEYGPPAQDASFNC